MEFELFKWIVVTLLGVAGYFLKRNIDQLDKDLLEHKQKYVVLQKDVQTIREEYLHKNDFKEFKIELREMFNELKNDIRNSRDN